MENAFTEGERAAWGGLLETFSHLSARIDDDLRARFGISHVEFEVLLRLAFAEGRRLRIQDLAARSILTRSGMSRAVERLERAGLVIREAAPEDGRGAYAVLTDVGLAHFETAATAHMDFVRRNFLELFSETELVQMAGFWERVRGQQTG